MLFPGRRLPAREKNPALCVLCASVVKLRQRGARERLPRLMPIATYKRDFSLSNQPVKDLTHRLVPNQILRHLNVHIQQEENAKLSGIKENY